MTRYVCRFLQSRWAVGCVALALVAAVYFAGLAALHHWAQGAESHVLGLQTYNRSNAPLRKARLAYAPDTSLPQPIDGKASVIFRVPTSQPVVFLTIDDGFYREPQATQAMVDAHIAATFFLVKQYVAATPHYFGDLAQQTGSSIEDHTIDHKDLTTLPYAEQKREICETADAFANDYGRRPQLFRPPYGSYNDDTKRAAAACGMRSVVHWHALVENGVVYYQTGNKLQPGDIVLMHFTPNFLKDLAAFVAASKEAHVTPQPLDAWLAAN